MTNRVKYESSFCGRLLPENLLKAQGNWPTFIASSRDWRYLAPWSASDINEAARLKKPIEKVIEKTCKPRACLRLSTTALGFAPFIESAGGVRVIKAAESVGAT